MSLEQELVNMVISDVLKNWPQTAKVFHVYNMACVGCAVDSFCSVIDAANEYNIPLQVLVGELLVMIHEVDTKEE